MSTLKPSLRKSTLRCCGALSAGDHTRTHKQCHLERGRDLGRGHEAQEQRHGVARQLLQQQPSQPVKVKRLRVAPVDGSHASAAVVLGDLPRPSLAVSPRRAPPLTSTPYTLDSMLLNMPMVCATSDVATFSPCGAVRRQTRAWEWRALAFQRNVSPMRSTKKTLLRSSRFSRSPLRNHSSGARRQQRPWRNAPSTVLTAIFEDVAQNLLVGRVLAGVARVVGRARTLCGRVVKNVAALSPARVP